MSCGEWDDSEALQIGKLKWIGIPARPPMEKAETWSFEKTFFGEFSQGFQTDELAC